MSNATLYDYTNALYELLPPGLAFNRRPDSNTYKLISALATEFLEIDDQLETLKAEACPYTMTAFTNTRYAEVGLPDECGTAVTTQEAKKIAVLAKLINRGGCSKSYFEQIAAAYGLVVKIKDQPYKPFRCGVSGCGSALGDKYVYVWQIFYLNTSATFFRAGLSHAGDPLDTATTVGISCIFEKLKPAHTFIQYFPVTSQAALDAI